MQYRVEYFEGEDGQWYTSIRHKNGQKLYTSEGYTRRESAVETLENFVKGICQEAGSKEYANIVLDSEAYVSGVIEKLYAGSERDGQQ